MNILSIETSCDETALAIVECSGGAKKPQFKVLKNIVSSQIELHRPFGGVVPNIAKREHIANLPKLLAELKAKPKDVDAIAVTVGPGLEPALWAGITFAQQLAKDLKKPLLGANHMEGHMYSILLDQKPGTLTFPAVGLVVSGGHTMIVKMDSYTKWKNLGETRDDAAGEAFDKVARLLELPYPGGPEISKLALQGDPKSLPFPRPMINSNDFEFSFSGLKTAILYYLRDNPDVQSGPRLQNKESNVRRGKKITKADIAASFQQAVLDVLIKKTMKAARQFGAQTVFICGGVAANKELRKQLGAQCEKQGIKFMSPDNKYNTDNAAMIAAAAYLASLRKKKYKMVADSTMSL